MGPKQLISLSILILWAVVVNVGAAFSRSQFGFAANLIDDSDSVSKPVGLCASAVIIHGYPCQEFDVRTDDGYILSLQRIPGGRAGGGGGDRKPPALLQHGLLVDGVSWLLNSPHQSLALILADTGFDVWISNTRGTRFSRRHVTLDPTQPEYWNWTWDDLVIHDLPVAFDFVFKKTGQSIHYVGHSMGTLIALAYLSEDREIKKIKSAALLCPIAYLSHMSTTLGVVAAQAFVGEITTVFGLAEFNPKDDAVTQLLRAFCLQPGVDCYNLLTSLTGENCCLNSSTVEVFLKNEPQSTATKNLVHLAQTVRDGKLAKYDYGNADFNLAHYGQTNPPIYNLSKIPHDLPLFLSYGGRDALSPLILKRRYYGRDSPGSSQLSSTSSSFFFLGVSSLSPGPPLKGKRLRRLRLAASRVFRFFSACLFSKNLLRLLS